MNLKRLIVPFAVVLGTLGLCVSLVGAKWGTSHGQPTESAAPDDLSGVRCTGTVDGVDGVQPLAPSLSAPVLAVRVQTVHVKENERVTKGRPLLTLDDQLARLNEEKAAAAVAEAEGKLDEARQGLRVHALLVAEQQLAVEAKEAQYRGAEIQLERLKRIQKQMDLSNNDEIKTQTANLEALAKGVEAERKKLEEVKAREPSPLVRQAEAAVNRLTVMQRQAEAARKEYELLAPADGLILRSNVDAGSVFSAQSRQPAFWFLPNPEQLVVRAEVDQEFAGRLHEGQTARVRDDAVPAQVWTGKVTRMGSAFLPRRPLPGVEGLSLSEPMRTLETLVTLDPSPTPLRVGQRVRLNIGE